MGTSADDVVAPREPLPHLGGGHAGKRRSVGEGGLAGPPHHDDPGQLPHPVEAVPLGRVGHDVGADHQGELPVGVLLHQVLEGAGGLPHQRVVRQVGLGGADVEAAQGRRRQLAHAHPVLEGRERLAERVAEAGQHPDLGDPLRGQRPVGGHHVGHVRRVEGATQDRGLSHGAILPQSA